MIKNRFLGVCTVNVREFFFGLGFSVVMFLVLAVMAQNLGWL